MNKQVYMCYFKVARGHNVPLYRQVEYNHKVVNKIHKYFKFVLSFTCFGL